MAVMKSYICRVYLQSLMIEMLQSTNIFVASTNRWWRYCFWGCPSVC